MRIVIATPYFHPRVGGVEKYTYQTAKRLADNGNEIIVITSDYEGRRRKNDVQPNLTIHRLSPLFTLSKTPIHPLWILELDYLFKKYKPDIVVGHTPVPYLSDIAIQRAKRQNIATVLTYHNDIVKTQFPYKHLVKPYYLFLGSRTLRLSDTIITTSNHYVRQSPFLRSYKDRIRIIPPGIDPDHFHQRSRKEVYKLRESLLSDPQSEKIVFFLGQLNKSHSHKGLSVLLESLSMLTDQFPNQFNLLVGGEGDKKQSYVQLAEQLNISDRVVFSGYISESDLPKYYSAADMTVLPSTDKSEGFGMVLIESLACGTPVIGSAVGGIPSVIEPDKHGLLVPPNDVEALADAILQVAKTDFPFSPSNIRNQYNWDTIAKETFDVFETTLDYSK